MNFDLILILNQVSKQTQYETFFNNSFDHWIKWCKCIQSSPIIRFWYLCWWFATAWLWSHWLEPYQQWGCNGHRPFRRSSVTGTFPTELFRKDDKRGNVWHQNTKCCWSCSTTIHGTTTTTWSHQKIRLLNNSFFECHMNSSDFILGIHPYDSSFRDESLMPNYSFIEFDAIFRGIFWYNYVTLFMCIFVRFLCIFVVVFLDFDSRVGSKSDDPWLKVFDV